MTDRGIGTVRVLETEEWEAEVNDEELTSWKTFHVLTEG